MSKASIKLDESSTIQSKSRYTSDKNYRQTSGNRYDIKNSSAKRESIQAKKPFETKVKLNSTVNNISSSNLHTNSHSKLSGNRNSSSDKLNKSDIHTCNNNNNNLNRSGTLKTID